VSAVGVNTTVMVSGMLIVVFLYLGNGNVFTAYRTLMKPCIAKAFIEGAIGGSLDASGLRKIGNDARKEARLAGDFKNLPLDCAAAEKLLNVPGGPVCRSSHEPAPALSAEDKAKRDRLGGLSNERPGRRAVEQPEPEPPEPEPPRPPPALLKGKLVGASASAGMSPRVRIKKALLSVGAVLGDDPLLIGHCRRYWFFFEKSI
jgi:hypothetical protein